MLTWDRLIGTIILLWALVYTASFGIWTWKRKNKLGAIMVFVLAAAMVVLPAYTVFFR